MAARPTVLDKAPSRFRMISIPIASVIVGSMLASAMPFVSQMPWLPPLGLVMLLAWRLLRPELWPVWIGAPLGLFDDMISGQPFGSAIFIWSAALLALAVIEQRLRWHDYWLEWGLAIGLITGALLVALGFANLTGGATRVVLVVPQWLASVLAYPVCARIAAALDSLRLGR